MAEPAGMESDALLSHLPPSSGSKAGSGVASESAAAQLAGHPWATPGRLTALLCVLNALIYLDRGTLSSTAVLGRKEGDGGAGADEGIIGEFGLSSAQAGMLQSAFMVGLMVSSPVFARLAHARSALHCIAGGLGLWVLAVAGCSIARSYAQLVACRCIVGAGEASIVCLAAPFIDDYAPRRRKTIWLGLFYVWIAAGTALGYVFGGVVEGLTGSWRWVFGVEAMIGLPLVLFCALSRPIPLGRRRLEPSHEGSRVGCSSFAADVRTLLLIAPYVASIVSSGLYTGALGTLSVWGPTAAREAYSSLGDDANIAIGGATVVSGIVGTLSGGLLLDKLGGTAHRAFALCGCSTVVGGLVLLGGFACDSVVGFLSLFSVAFVALMLPQAAVNAAQMWIVPTELRGLAMSLCVNAIHLLGDVPMPPLAGVLQDRLHDWRSTMSIMCLLFLPAGLGWGLAAYLSFRHHKRSAARSPLEQQRGGEAT